jgi:hypothetical protein
MYLSSPTGKAGERGRAIALLPRIERSVTASQDQPPAKVRVIHPGHLNKIHRDRVEKQYLRSRSYSPQGMQPSPQIVNPAFLRQILAGVLLPAARPRPSYHT